tara:strand:- start:87 stop:368 length:282 start_codon:yes stop_codon:yes gene_type:complete
MHELVEAIKKIKGILRRCEEEGDNFQETLGKLGDVKVHGVVFPTLMLMEIIDDFSKGYQERRKGEALTGFDEEKLQEKYREAAHNWNNKDTIN